MFYSHKKHHLVPFALVSFTQPPHGRNIHPASEYWYSYTRCRIQESLILMYRKKKIPFISQYIHKLSFFHLRTTRLNLWYLLNNGVPTEAHLLGACRGLYVSRERSFQQCILFDLFVPLTYFSRHHWE